MARTIPSAKDFETAKPLIAREVMQEKIQRFMLDWMDRQKQTAEIVDNRVKR